MTDPNPFHSYFHKIAIADLIKLGDVKFLTAEQSVEVAMKFLSDNKILGAPAVNAEGHVLGMVDILDIVQHVVKVAPDAISMKYNPNALETAARAIAWKNVGEVVNESGRDPLVPIYAEDPATSAIGYFARGFHRSPIFDRSKTVVGVLSQTSIVARMAEMLKHGDNKAIGARTLQSLGLGMAEPITVKESATVLEALETVSSNRVSAVAVVDANGKLTGNFSASDLRGVYAERLPGFNKSVKDFLEEHSPRSLSARAIYRNSTLAEVIDELQNERVHRVWVIDADFKPVGIVSNTDLMALAHNFANYAQ